ncbi:MAG: heme lyase CcmF/NrfE family subunit [Chloroflexi bacterium]|nr:heme lyase CcmF/NrfE family subunit [Chloroflexota bacterium]
MLAEIGIVTTGLAFGAAVFALVMAVLGAVNRRDQFVLSARNAALAAFPLVTISCGVLVVALLNQEFSLVYVADTTDASTPDFYQVTALWGGQAGSLLFWSWLLAAFAFVALLANWRSHRRLMPWVIVATMATLAFFLFLNTFIENPFERTWETPGVGVEEALFAPYSNSTVFEDPTPTGGSPLLRHFGMAIHPPMLYLGFVGFTIPFAFAFAALVTGRLNSDWLRATRHWALIAWLFLTLGLMLGGRWAYDVLGWGGYWGWDPVENAALLPWLTGTAFLHSAVVQEKRGMLKFWNMLLIVLTFLLVILGTFATRSGVVSSVHSFAQSEIGPLMFGFLGVAMIASIGLLLWRQERGHLRGADELDSLFSRESLFLLNNWVFLALTIVVFWGTWAEAITTILQDLGLRDTVVTLGPDWYAMGTRPLFAVIFVLMGVAPLAAWRRSTARRLGQAILIPTLIAVFMMVLVWIWEMYQNNVWETLFDSPGDFFGEMTALTGDLMWALLGYGLVTFAALATITEIWKGVAARHRRGEGYFVALRRLVARDRHRYGGYFVHLGMVIIGLGIIGSSGFQQTTMETLNQGDRLDLGPYEMRYDQLYDAVAEDGRWVTYAEVTLFRGDREVATLNPRWDLFPQNRSAIPDLHSTLENDFYVRIAAIDANNPTRVRFRAYVNPLINFVWLGGFILIFGTMVALWPNRQPRRAAQSMSVPSGMGGEPAGAGK